MYFYEFIIISILLLLADFMVNPLSTNSFESPFKCYCRSCNCDSPKRNNFPNGKYREELLQEKRREIDNLLTKFRTVEGNSDMEKDSEELQRYKNNKWNLKDFDKDYEKLQDKKKFNNIDTYDELNEDKSSLEDPMKNYDHYLEGSRGRHQMYRNRNLNRNKPTMGRKNQYDTNFSPKGKSFLNANNRGLQADVSIHSIKLDEIHDHEHETLYESERHNPYEYHKMVDMNLTTEKPLGLDTTTKEPVKYDNYPLGIYSDYEPTNTSFDRDINKEDYGSREEENTQDYNKKSEGYKNNLSHEANYKLSKGEQEAVKPNRTSFWKWPWCLNKRSMQPFGNTINGKTKSHLMGKGFDGSYLPSYSENANQRDFISNRKLDTQRKEVLMNPAGYLDIENRDDSAQTSIQSPLYRRHRHNRKAHDESFLARKKRNVVVDFKELFPKFEKELYRGMENIQPLEEEEMASSSRHFANPRDYKENLTHSKMAQYPRKNFIKHHLQKRYTRSSNNLIKNSRVGHDNEEDLSSLQYYDDTDGPNFDQKVYFNELDNYKNQPQMSMKSETPRNRNFNGNNNDKMNYIKNSEFSKGTFEEQSQPSSRYRNYERLQKSRHQNNFDEHDSLTSGEIKNSQISKSNYLNEEWNSKKQNEQNEKHSKYKFHKGSYMGRTKDIFENTAQYYPNKRISNSGNLESEGNNHKMMNKIELNKSFPSYHKENPLKYPYERENSARRPTKENDYYLNSSEEKLYPIGANHLFENRPNNREWLNKTESNKASSTYHKEKSLKFPYQRENSARKPTNEKDYYLHYSEEKFNSNRANHRYENRPNIESNKGSPTYHKEKSLKYPYQRENSARRPTNENDKYYLHPSEEKLNTDRASNLYENRPNTRTWLNQTESIRSYPTYNKEKSLQYPYQRENSARRPTNENDYYLHSSQEKLNPDRASNLYENRPNTRAWLNTLHNMNTTIFGNGSIKPKLNSSDEVRTLALQFRNEILNCTVFSSLEDFLNALPKNETTFLKNNSNEIKIEFTTKPIPDFLKEMPESMGKTIPVSNKTTMRNIISKNSRKDMEPDTYSDEDNLDDTTECEDPIGELPNKYPNDDYDENYPFIPRTDDDDDEDEVSTQSPNDTFQKPYPIPLDSLGSKINNDVKLNITINANVQGNSKRKHFHGKGSIDIKPGYRDDRNRRDSRSYNQRLRSDNNGNHLETGERYVD
ncbi:uncharacterized protein LOC142240851 isoform X2 [Haematobia irritans]|uniref:uncharacterized protein LOC142240851 isoform X2 n=1 Tax=Haematobia irritans TaxID=7368 RepID=UPI003F501011